MNSKATLPIYAASLLLIVTGTVFTWLHWPYGHLLTNLGFTPYVVLKILAFTEYRFSEWDWTDKVRFALAWFLAAMLVLRYLNLYNSDVYFLLALAVDYTVGRQLSVRRGDT
ncbi:MAG: hypothetical protein H7Z75_05530 [Ferruginibacter sp.]|nr:hypothetical protein [Cytophagales bacterium]